MTKKDYILIASTLNSLYNTKKISLQNKNYILKIALELSKQFKKQNQQFNTKKFLEIIVP
jgi:hypothetical protein